MGAISHMNQLYRENMERKRSSRYNKKSGGKFAKANTYRRHQGDLKTPELTFQERTKLKQRLKARRRSHRNRLAIATSIGAALVLIVSIWFVKELNKTITFEATSTNEFIKEREENYALSFSYGNEYTNKGEWYNAAFEYRNSLKYKPESQEALQRLTFSLMQLCETQDRGCDEAEERLEDLENTDFNPEAVKELRLRWEGIIQHNP